MIKQEQEQIITEELKEKFEEAKWWQDFRVGGIYFANQKAFERRMEIRI